MAVGLCLVLLLVCFLAGSFFNAVSRESGCRFLRPAGTWFFFSGAGYLLTVVVIALDQLGAGNCDNLGASLVFSATGLLGFEMWHHLGAEPLQLLQNYV